MFPFFSLVADLSPELAAMLLAVVIGGYTLIGGLGATFYVSYFNTALIFFLIILLMVEVRVKYILQSHIDFLFSRCSSTHSSMWTIPLARPPPSLSLWLAGRRLKNLLETMEAHTSHSSAQVSWFSQNRANCNADHEYEWAGFTSYKSKLEHCWSGFSIFCQYVPTSE